MTKNSLINTPCRLIYIQNNKSIEIKPALELDFDKLSQLWGIECGGIYVGLYNEPFGNWNKALAIANEATKYILGGSLLDKWQFQLPSANELRNCFLDKKKFKNTIDIICENTPWEPNNWQKGWHWSKDELNAESVRTFDMKDGIYSAHDRTDNNGFIRLKLARCE